MNFSGILIIATGALMAVLAGACGGDEVVCDDGRVFASCAELNDVRNATGSGSQASATLELCFSRQCDGFMAGDAPNEPNEGAQ